MRFNRLSRGSKEKSQPRKSDGYSLCMHRPSVQFLDWSTMPSQSLPPFLGAGALHSLLLQCVHSVPHVDHLLHSVHKPSTGNTVRERVLMMEAELQFNHNYSAKVEWCRDSSSHNSSRDSKESSVLVCHEFYIKFLSPRLQNSVALELPFCFWDCMTYIN